MTRLPDRTQTEEPSVVAGPFVFTREDFRRISSMLHEDAGIYLSDAKITLVYSRLAKRLRALGLESFRDYCALVASEKGIDERQRMLAALTTNVTSFFREPHHFEHLKNTVLSTRAQAVRRGGRLRIWSSACSDGQEPYSIAMTILSVIPEASTLDIRVLASDIDPNMVAAGTTGVYGDDAMSAVPRDMKARWFHPTKDGAKGGWAVSRELASLVVFRELNLVRPWPFKGQFDAIFCRNVVIYFEEETQNAVWSRFTPTLTSDGRLYIGHSERICGAAANDFESDGITTYRLRQRKNR
jgi:chemotaxis protein methyltransferase CheR